MSEPEVEVVFENEVKVTPGRCVTWNCYNETDGRPECPEHAAEPLPKAVPPNYRERRRRDTAARRSILSKDPEWVKSEKKRLDIIRKSPAYRARQAANKRAKRVAIRAMKELAINRKAV